MLLYLTIPSMFGLALLVAAIRGAAKRLESKILLTAVALAVPGAALVSAAFGMSGPGGACDPSRVDCSLSLAGTFATREILVSVGLALLIAAFALAMMALLVAVRHAGADRNSARKNSRKTAHSN